MLFVPYILTSSVVASFALEEKCFQSTVDRQRIIDTQSSASVASITNCSTGQVHHGNPSMSSAETSSYSTVVSTFAKLMDEDGTETTRQQIATEINPRALWQYQRGSAILQYAPPFLVVMATVGNTASVVILRHPTFRKSSTSFILSALAVVDLLIVSTGLVRQWLIYQFHTDVRRFTTFGCKLHIFLVYCLPMVRFHSLIT